MKILVMKFGGTSVATAESRNTSAMRVVSAREQGYSPVVVVSAIGRKGAPYATDTLISFLKEVDPQVNPHPRELDIMMACGEILSSVVFAHTLRSLGYPAVALTGLQAGIRTDENFGSARIAQIDASHLHKLIDDGKIPVVCGFQGYFDDASGVNGEITTLGRGGSDTTGSALGAALKAEAVEIYTDVDGVKTADPDYVENAPTLRKVTYDEVAEIAHLGAKVLHPRAAEIAMRYNIPLYVKSTFSDAPGTMVVRREDFPGRRVTGVTHTGKLVYLRLNLSSMPDKDRQQIEQRIYDVLAAHGANLFMLSLSPTGTGFAVPRSQFPMVESLLNGLVLPVEGEKKTVYLMQIGAVATKAVETQARLLEPLGPLPRIKVEVVESCTMVSIIGHEYLQQPGILLRAIQTLHEAQIPVLQTTDSEFSLSCLIPESETRRAVYLLHEAFNLSDIE
jgi:aspartate kinase